MPPEPVVPEKPEEEEVVIVPEFDPKGYDFYEFGTQCTGLNDQLCQ